MQSKPSSCCINEWFPTKKKNARWLQKRGTFTVDNKWLSTIRLPHTHYYFDNAYSDKYTISSVIDSINWEKDQASKHLWASFCKKIMKLKFARIHELDPNTDTPSKLQFDDVWLVQCYSESKRGRKHQNHQFGITH